MKILYVDDEQSALDAFLREHAIEGISIEVCQDAYRLIENLEKSEKRELPDLIVMDLYRTTSELNSDSAKKTNQKVDELVLQIAETRKELGELVASKKVPVGIDVLEKLKQSRKLQDIPVILNTREGLNLLGDDLIRKSVKLGADWMIKGKSPEVIRELMCRKFRETKEAKRRIKRDVAMMLIGSVLGALIGFLLNIYCT